MSVVNYKDKYLQLKQKFMESVDVAFRLGYEQGAQATQMQQMQQQSQQIADQQAQQAQMEANGMGGQQPGQDDNQDPSQPGAQIQDDSRGVGQQTGAAAGAPAGQSGLGGSELDQHIGQLEGLMAKTEYGTEQWETLNKSITNLKSIKVALDLKKNEQLIKSISSNIRKPLVISGRAKHNLNQPAKEAITMQHKIVNELMENWEKEEQGLPTEISKILQSEGLSKKE